MTRTRRVTLLAAAGLAVATGGSAVLASSAPATSGSAGSAGSVAAYRAPGTTGRAASSESTTAAPRGDRDASGGSALAGVAGTSLPCNRTPAGGDWPSYGHDAANSRSQPLETSLTPSAGTGLSPAWTFSLASQGDTGQFQSTPIVIGGCAFVGSTNGTVYAVNATTGKPVWHQQVLTPPAGSTTVPTTGLGGALVGSLVAAGGRVIAFVDAQGDGAANGPYLVALNQQTGAVAWRSAPITTASGYYSNASPQVFNGIVFAGFSPPEGETAGQGGFALLDAATGHRLTLTTTVSPADQKLGYAGGGIWSTPAYDPATQYAYVGAGNPYSKTVEDPHTNAILKVDLDRHRATFGQIVASYKGNVDQYTSALQQLSQTPACTASEAAPSPLDDPVCGQLDLDFGAAPNLFTVNGHLVVGDLQKSGVYHVADATAMTPVWSTVVGLSCQLCNAASTAVADGQVFGEGTPGGLAFGLAQATGSQVWSTPVGDGVHYQSTSTANGVVYTFDTTGFLDMFAAVNGSLIARRPISVDVGQPAASFTSGGIAIADGTVFVAAAEGGPEAGTPQGGFLVAYR